MHASRGIQEKFTCGEHWAGILTLMVGEFVSARSGLTKVNFSSDLIPWHAQFYQLIFPLGSLLASDANTGDSTADCMSRDDLD